MGARWLHDYHIRFGYEYESITVSNKPVGLTVSKAKDPKGNWICNRIFITAEDAEMRFRYDGTAPTATEGHILGAGDTLAIDGVDNIGNFKAIRTGTDDGKLRVTYEDGAGLKGWG